jgi:hypothetical protein
MFLPCRPPYDVRRDINVSAGRGPTTRAFGKSSRDPRFAVSEIVSPAAADGK